MFRDSTTLDEARRRVVRSMNIRVGTTTFRRFIDNERKRIGEPITLKLRLTWEERLTDEQKERIVALFRDSTTLEEARRRVVRSMNIRVGTATFRRFIDNEQERTREPITLKPRPTWEGKTNPRTKRRNYSIGQSRLSATQELKEK